MDKEITLIQQYAREFEKLEKNEAYLFEQLNTLNNDRIEQLINEFASAQFQPVNLLRLEMLNQLKENIKLSSRLISEIKQRIVNRDKDYFSKYGEKLTTGLLEYPKKKKSPFVNWQKFFSIAYPFFYNSEIKKESKNALENIANELIKELELDQYKTHWVSFDGPQNYGASSCWIALFPKTKVSHIKSYQLFLRISGETLESGIQVGWDIKDKSASDLEKYSRIEEVIKKLKASKETVKEKNDSLINHWKYAPGENARYWDEFYNQSCWQSAK